MKINEIISEALIGPGSQMSRYTHPDIENAPSKEVQTLVGIINQLMGEGHADGVNTNVVLNKIIERTKKPFSFDDLVNLNNSSQELQHLIATMDANSIKFRQEKIKNEDPYKEKQEQQSKVAQMAQRAGAARG